MTFANPYIEKLAELDQEGQPFVSVTMIGVNAQNWPSTVSIANQAGEFGQQEHILTAGAFVQAVVPLAVFFMLQRFFVRGILAGSVKG